MRQICSGRIRSNGRFCFFVAYYRDNITIKKFGERLREIRLSKNISQEQLALECGLEYSQINRIELGKVNTSISHIALLAKHLGVTPCDFFECI